MTNEEYVSALGDMDFNVRNNLLNVMDKYGDNKWWLSEDQRVLGYYQLNEEILLMPFSKFHECFEKLLGRPVWTHEFGLCYEELKQQAERAWNEYVTDEQKQSDIANGFLALAKTTHNHNI
jgi:hypothetical protein